MATGEASTSCRAGDYSELSDLACQKAVSGSLSDIALMCDQALHSKSYGVRLASGTALSEIIYRARTEGSFREEEIEKVLALIRFVDPEISPSLILVLGAVGDSRSLVWLGRLLKDLRTTVRVAAMSSLRRLVLSHHSFQRVDLRRLVNELLLDKKVPPEIGADLICLCTEVGWELSGVQRSSLSSEVAERAPLRSRLEGWTGLWLSEGRDVWAPGAIASHWMAIGGGWIGCEDGSLSGFFVSSGRGVSTARPDPLRMIWAPRRGSLERHQALQSPRRTWYRATTKQVQNWVQLNTRRLDSTWQPILADVV